LSARKLLIFSGAPDAPAARTARSGYSLGTVGLLLALLFFAGAVSAQQPNAPATAPGCQSAASATTQRTFHIPFRDAGTKTILTLMADQLPPGEISE
jgi:hypothetical protein